jgi:hypothetical protein
VLTLGTVQAATSVPREYSETGASDGSYGPSCGNWHDHFHLGQCQPHALSAEDLVPRTALSPLHNLTGRIRTAPVGTAGHDMPTD